MEVFGVAVAAVAVLLAVLAYQLSSGPVPISILNQIIKDEATSALPDGRLDIDDTVLSWSADDRRLSFRLLNVRLFGESDNLIASVPQLAFTLSVPALFRGQLSPTSIDFIGVEAQLLRREGEGITLGLSTDPSEPLDADATSAIAPIIEALANNTSDIPLLQYLTRFGIRQGKLRIVDEVNDVNFDAPNANLIIFRGQGGLAGSLSADLLLGETRAHLELNGALSSDSDIANIDAHVTGLVPAALASMSPSFSDYAHFNAPIESSGTLKIDTLGNVRSAELSIEAGAGRIRLPEPWLQDLPLEKAHAEITLDGASKHIDISQMEFLAGAHSATLKGGIDYVNGTGFNIDGVSVDLVFSDIKTEVPGFFEGPVTAEEARIKGKADFVARHIDLDLLNLTTGTGRLSLSGTVAQATRSPVVHIKGTLDNMPLETLRALWPLPVADGARVWMSENLNGGTISNGNIRLDLEDGMIADAEQHIAMPEDAIDVQFDLAGSTIRYMKKMPLIEGAEAHGVLRGNSFEATIPTGFVTLPNGTRLTVTDGKFVDHEISHKGADGIIDFAMSGQTADILTLLDHEPLNLISKFGLDPATIGGTSKLTARITLPMIKHITLDDVKIAGQVRSEKVVVPNVQKNMSVTDGTLDIDVTRAGLNATGPIFLNGIGPIDLEWQESFRKNSGKGSSYQLRASLDDHDRSVLGFGLTEFLHGPVGFDATLSGSGREVNKARIIADLTKAKTRVSKAGWTKEAGVPAKAVFDLDFLKDKAFGFRNFVLTGKDVDVRGAMTMADGGHLEEARFENARLGPDNDFTFVAKRLPTGQMSLDLTARKFDVSGLLTDIFGGGEKPMAVEPAASADDKTILPPGHKIAPSPADEVALSLTPEVLADMTRRTLIRADIAAARAHGNARFTDVRAKVTLIDGTLYLMNVSGTDQTGKPLTALTSMGRGRTRDLKVSSDNAGTLLEAIDLFPSAQGGKLRATGTFDDTMAGSPLKGSATVTDFRIVNAPVLAKILTLASFTGIGDAMSGEGIQFDNLELGYRLTEHRIYIDEARMTGPSIGLTLKGQVDRQADKLDLEGTIVPAYTVNSILGNIPLIGPLIVGREGEGIFAFTYRVRGQTSDPNVFVNPLSVVAPGFLRRLFEFGSNMKPEPTTEPMATAPVAEEPEAEAAATGGPTTPPTPLGKPVLAN
ncbi:MAG: hypothetical protein GC184_07650 [Rhizobiales bacterium]|nr:hypothetical protein [Hyphomicrobiales bacterium]